MRNVLVFLSTLFAVLLALWGIVGFISFSWNVALWPVAGRVALVFAWLGLGLPFSACATDEFIASTKKKLKEQGNTQKN